MSVDAEEDHLLAWTIKDVGIRAVDGLDRFGRGGGTP